VVYHLAAVITLQYRRDDQAVEVNVRGTRNVVESCLACGVRRLVHFSSIHAFSAFPADAVVDETRPRCGGPESLVYDRSKAAGEEEVLRGVAKGLDAVIINPTGVLGPHDYKRSLMGQVLLDLYRGRLPVFVQGGFNWVDARDVCLGAMAAERLGRTGERYILGGHYLTNQDLAREIQEVTGARPPRMHVPIWLARLGLPFAAGYSRITGTTPRFTRASLHALAHHQKVSHEKAVRELAYEPRPIRRTFEDTFTWFREMGHV
jgi:dihydroflavonol-4-reductase